MGQYAKFPMPTTAGILDRDNYGHQRLTVSNHGFLYSNEGFHPSNDRVQIGVLDERWNVLHPKSCTDIAFARMRTYRGFEAMAAVPRDGICGAALVEYDSEEGGVAGFFQNGNDYYAWSPCLDQFIDRSWGVV